MFNLQQIKQNVSQFLTECIIFLSGSHISLYPSLNFVVYVPPQRQTPLYMKTKDGTT